VWNANAYADCFANSDSYIHAYSNSYWNTQLNTNRYRKSYSYQANTNTKTCSDGCCAAYSTSSLDACADSDVATTYSGAPPIDQLLKF
jgi:hypothetical protein